VPTSRSCLAGTGGYAASSDEGRSAASCDDGLTELIAYRHTRAVCGSMGDVSLGSTRKGVALVGALAFASLGGAIWTRSDLPRPPRSCELLTAEEVNALAGATLKPFAAQTRSACVYSLDPPHTVVSFSHATPPYVTVFVTRNPLSELEGDNHRPEGWEVVPADVGDRAVLVRDVNAPWQRRELQVLAGELFISVDVGVSEPRQGLEGAIVRTVTAALRRKNL
jgi:hypothetical protein